MYSIPNDITNTFLNNDAVKMICYNINQIYIHFESSISIAIEGQFILTKDGVEHLFDVYPVSFDHGLLALLENKVRSVNISNSRKNLEIEFENGAVLIILGSDDYESYTIKIDDRAIII